MARIQSRTVWAIKWRMVNKTDGETRFLLWKHGVPLVFDTRKLAREYINKRYSSLKQHIKLKRAPRILLVPKAVKAIVSIEEVRECPLNKQLLM